MPIPGCRIQLTATRSLTTLMVMTWPTGMLVPTLYAHHLNGFRRADRNAGAKSAAEWWPYWAMAGMSEGPRQCWLPSSGRQHLLNWDSVLIDPIRSRITRSTAAQTGIALQLQHWTPFDSSSVRLANRRLHRSSSSKAFHFAQWTTTDWSPPATISRTFTYWLLRGSSIHSYLVFA